MAETAYHKIRTERAPAPSGCPVDHAFSPFSETYLRDPYAELAKRRNSAPAFYSEELGYLVLTRMEDVAEVFRRSDVFSSENVQDPVLPVCERAQAVLAAPDYNPIAILSNRPQPDHTRIRKHTQACFSSRRIRTLPARLLLMPTCGRLFQNWRCRCGARTGVVVDFVGHTFLFVYRRGLFSRSSTLFLRRRCRIKTWAPFILAS